MKPPTLCPACLTVLPYRYPYDHVAIDQVLAGNRGPWQLMDTAERAETVRESVRRGVSMTRLSLIVRMSGYRLTGLLKGGAKRLGGANDGPVRELWAQGLSDLDIGERLGLPHSTVFCIRYRLGLAANRRPGGQPRKQVAA